MATNFTTTNLANFTNANPLETIALVILNGKGTKDHYSFQEGVKYQTKIPYISDVSLDLSTGALGGFNTGSGSTAVKDVTLSTVPVKIFENYTKEVLNRTILAALAKKGSNPEELPLAEAISLLKGQQFFVELEKLRWQADTSTTVQTAGTTINSFDGVLAQMRGGVAGNGNPAVDLTTYSDASVLQHVRVLYNKMITALPQYTTIDTVLSMSPANFATYARAVYGLNTTILTTTMGDNKSVVDSGEFIIPGTKCKAVAEIGLNGKNQMVMTRPENIIAVYDLKSEEETLDLWYNKAAYRWELVGLVKVGVQVVDVSSCVFSA